jgi:hypothetical protein
LDFKLEMNWKEACVTSSNDNDNDNDNDDGNDNDKPIKSLFKGKGLLPPVGLARLDS